MNLSTKIFNLRTLPSAGPTGSPNYANRNLDFPANGYRDHNRTLQDFNNQVGNESSSNPQYGDKGYYRTSDSSQYFVINYRTSQINSNINLVVTQILDGRGANVRCVRK
ncbi:hypothetical protein [Sphingobacterium sp.]|uniref:hypothetical protein n=1 Tax=Sphingobacterium sp. TaxID=341027 RepID=UPI0028AD5F6C|nr:hypothetical protein [Sphingobacterium sp.]